MTALVGAPDFQAQNAQSLRFLTAVTVNTIATQQFDLSNLIAPNDQGFVFFWVGIGPGVGRSIVYLLQANLPTINLSTNARIFDGRYSTVPMFGSLFTAGQVAGITLFVNPPVDDPGLIGGQIFIFALTGPPSTISVVKRDLIGQGLTTGNVAIPTVATTSILPIPPDGMYYRIKLLAWSIGAVTAANTGVRWQRSDTHAALTQYTTLAVGSQTQVIPLDCEWDFGLEVNNGSNQGGFASVLYEQWFK